MRSAHQRVTLLCIAAGAVIGVPGCARISQADAGLVVWTSSGLRTRWLDRAMLVVSDRRFGLVLTLLCAAWLLTRQRNHPWRVVLVALALLAVSDRTAETIKYLAERPRPCLSCTRTLAAVPCPGSPSFPSSHATNITALAAFATVCDRRRWPVWVGMSLLMAISRVYLGVHYALDVAGGAALGAALGIAAALLARGWTDAAPAPVTG